MPVTAVSDSTFGRVVLTSMIPVLVQFSTEGSGPCKAMAPALDEISKELEGKVKVVKVDVDLNPTVKAEYLVRGLPTQILFKNGKPVARRLGGLVRKEEIEEWVKGALISALASRSPSTARRAAGFRLSNGMNVVVIPDHRAPIVTHMVWYRVGAADEPEGLSGIARFLEHLTFKSIMKTAAGGRAKAIARLGGEINAFSDSDTTVYYQRVAKEHLRTVMEMEADRMVHLDLTDDEVTVEREVLMELRRSTTENNSAEWLREAVAAAHYLGHRHGIPVIGLPDEMAKLTLTDVVRFHRLHYAPNNAVVVVCGDVMPKDVKQLSQETYGRLPANPMAGGQSRRQAPAHIATHRVVVKNLRSATAEFARRYAVPGYVAARRGEAEALEVLAWVLSASRLYRRLVVEDKSGSLVTGGYQGGVVDSGAIWINATASSGDLGALEAGVNAVVADICRNGITQEELCCAKSVLLANHIFDGSDQSKLARRYGRALAIGLTIDDVEGWPAAISEVTAAEIKEAAGTYLTGRRAVTGWLVSDKRARRPATLQRAHSR